MGQSSNNNNNDDNNNCPLEMHVFADSGDCNAQNTADAVGTIIPDNTCRSTQVESGSATELLPGNYRAQCTSDGRVAIYESGCLDSSCSSSNNNGNSNSSICDRQLDEASLYSRLSPPIFRIQSPDTGFVSCFVLKSANEQYQVVFYIYGDCEPCASTSSVNVTNSTSPSVSSSSTPRPTPRPTLRPTVAVTLEPTGAGIVIGVPNITNATTPTVSPTWEPTMVDSPQPTAPTATTTTAPFVAPQPVAIPTTTSSPPAVSEPTSFISNNTNDDDNQSVVVDDNSSSNKGVVAGVIVGVALILVAVLTAGFVMGRRLQKQHDLNSRKSSQSDGKDQPPLLLYGKNGNSNNGMLSPAMTSTFSSPTYESPIPADHMISVDEDQDDISTLEDPTVFTRDTRADSVVGTHFLDDPTVATRDTLATKEDSVMGTQFLLDGESTTRSNAGSISIRSSNKARLLDESYDDSNDSKAAYSMANQTTTSKRTEASSVIGVNFLEELKGAPQPQAEEDDLDEAAWRPGAKWFTK